MRPSLALVRSTCFLLSIAATCHLLRAGMQTGARQAVVDIEQVLSWLPADTETLLTAVGPFRMSNSLTPDDRPEDHRLTIAELDEHFEKMTLSMMLYLRKGQLGDELKDKEVLLALEGSRRFRAPTGLGEMRYEGCEIGVFASDLTGTSDALFKNAARSNATTEEIEEQRVLVFQEKLEQDILTLYVAFPQPNVVLVATEQDFLREVLARMRGPGGPRALPETLPEWKYVDRKAPFWGLRHFSREAANEDPSSPFGGRKSANLPDEQAIGFTYQFDTTRGMGATLTYLTSEKDALEKIERKRFPAAEPGTAGLHIQYRELDPGVIRGTYELSQSGSLSWFTFVLMANLGHAIYV